MNGLAVTCAWCRVERGQPISIPADGDCRSGACTIHAQERWVVLKKPEGEAGLERVVLPANAVDIVEEA